MRFCHSEIPVEVPAVQGPFDNEVNTNIISPLNVGTVVNEGRRSILFPEEVCFGRNTQCFRYHSGFTDFIYNICCCNDKDFCNFSEKVCLSVTLFTISLLLLRVIS